MAVKKEYPGYSMKEKYDFHSNRVFENHKAAGSHMSEREKAAFSMGYVTHARQVSGQFVYKNPDYVHKTEYGRMAQAKRSARR